MGMFICYLLLQFGVINMNDIAVIAVQNRNSVLLEYAILNKADINRLYKRPEFGKFYQESLLHSAVRNKDLKMVKLLIKHGANIDNANRPNVWSVVDFVFYYDAFSIFKYFIENGLKNFQYDYMSGLPNFLLYKSMAFDRPKYFKILVKRLTNLSMVVADGYDPIDLTPLGYSVECNRIWAAKLLLKHGVDINVLFGKNDKYYTPINALIYAVQKGRIDFVRLFLKYKPDLKWSGGFPENKTALQYAKDYGYNEIYELLRNAGAN